MSKIIEIESKFIDFAVGKNLQLKNNFLSFVVYQPKSKEYLAAISKANKKGVEHYVWTKESPLKAKKYTRLKLAAEEALCTPNSIVLMLFRTPDKVVQAALKMYDIIDHYKDHGIIIKKREMK